MLHKTYASYCGDNSHCRIERHSVLHIIFPVANSYLAYLFFNVSSERLMKMAMFGWYRLVLVVVVVF
jgi:hypothetical protein